MEERNGCVTLVGAGPGDAGLLTLAGRDALAAAEVVLFDRLVGDGILAMIPASAERIDVGKQKGRHPVPQEEINRLLVEQALRGKRVVRLKGGDPYLFGRGAEELDGLIAHDIPFRVIPGVTSALAAPAYAGIPVTHREHSSSLHIVTGHGKAGRPPDIPYPALARMGGTLVFLMGLTTLEAIRDGLLREGMPPSTPAALVENGTRPGQRRLVATLVDIAEKAAAAEIASPSVFVVGDVCALAERYDWLSRRPLHGTRILAASAQTTAGRLAEMLRRQGCRVDEFAAITPRPLRQPAAFWQTLSGYQWIVFTSSFGVDTFFLQLREHGRDVRAVAAAKFAAVGAQTAATLSGHGIAADFIPATYRSDALAEGLAAHMRPGEKALLFRAQDGSGELPSILRAKGVSFEDVAAYETLRNSLGADTAALVLSGAYDAVTFASASSVEAFVSSFSGHSLCEVRAVCIGDITAAAARDAGMRVETSPVATLDSMARVVMEGLGKS